MAAEAHMFNGAAFNAFSGATDYDSEAFKMILLDTTWTPDVTLTEYIQDSEVVGSVGAHELATAGGYTRGGKTLSHKSLSKLAGVTTWDNTDDSDTTWTSATFDTRYAVIYDNTNDPKDLVMYFDFGATKSVTGGTFVAAANAAGFFTIHEAT